MRERLSFFMVIGIKRNSQEQGTLSLKQSESCSTVGSVSPSTTGGVSNGTAPLQRKHGGVQTTSRGALALELGGWLCN